MIKKAFVSFADEEHPSVKEYNQLVDQASQLETKAEEAKQAILNIEDATVMQSRRDDETKAAGLKYGLIQLQIKNTKENIERHVYKMTKEHGGHKKTGEMINVPGWDRSGGSVSSLAFRGKIIDDAYKHPNNAGFPGVNTSRMNRDQMSQDRVGITSELEDLGRAYYQELRFEKLSKDPSERKKGRKNRHLAKSTSKRKKARYLWGEIEETMLRLRTQGGNEAIEEALSDVPVFRGSLEKMGLLIKLGEEGSYKKEHATAKKAHPPKEKTAEEKAKFVKSAKDMADFRAEIADRERRKKEGLPPKEEPKREKPKEEPIRKISDKDRAEIKEKQELMDKRFGELMQRGIEQQAEAATEEAKEAKEKPQQEKSKGGCPEGYHWVSRQTKDGKQGFCRKNRSTSAHELTLPFEGFR